MSWVYRALAVGVLIALLVLGYETWATHQQGIGEQRATTAYNLAIDQQKAAAATLLATETGKAHAATKALTDFKLEREKQDVESKSTIDNLAARLRTAAGLSGRLRDPNAAGCGGGGAGAPGADPAHANGGAIDNAQAGGLFSGPATELFQRLTREADDINIAYTSCRLDALSLREVLR